MMALRMKPKMKPKMEKKNKIYVYIREFAAEEKEKMISAAASLYAVRENIPRGKISYLDSGKPIFENGKGFLSISHTANIIFIAFSMQRIGIDAEFRRDISPRIAERFFFPDERDKDFFKIWTAKEAALKISGIGISGLGKCHICGGEAECGGEHFKIISLGERYGAEISIAAENDGDIEFL